MSAARIIETMGASVRLVDGKVKLSGLNALDSDTAARVLDVARTHKAELLAELREGASAPPVPPTASPMAALDRFFPSAPPHTFEGGAVGLVAPEYRPPSVEVVRCPVTREEHPRTACTAFGGCPSLNICRAFKRPVKKEANLLPPFSKASA